MSLTFSSTAGSDYNQSVVTMVTFGPGVTSASYPVSIVNDNNVESPKTFTVSASLTTAESNMAIVHNTAFVNILDDDCKLFSQHNNYTQRRILVCRSHAASEYCPYNR